VRLNSSRRIELGYKIAGPGKVRCEVAGAIIPPLPTLLVAIMLPAQLGIRAAFGAHTADRVSPVTAVALGDEV
jgi:hypothetical protein